MENIVILGFGLTGQSVYQTLKGQYNIYVQDDRLDEILDEGDFQVRKIENPRQIDRLDPSFIVKSPGIKPSNPYVAHAHDQAYDLISDLELAYRMYPSREIVAVTGTNGKTTTTSLISEILARAGYQVHTIGNIGRGILPAFASGSDEDIYLIELSSFQLEDTRDFKPQIGVFLNFTEDHLDWHGDLDRYFAAKSKLFANMNDEDRLILNKDSHGLAPVLDRGDILFSTSNQADYFIEGGQICGPSGSIMPVSSIKIPGDHNLENVLAAVATADQMGIDSKTIQESVEAFTGVAHRLEFVRTLDGVKYYNDSKGTNVDSTIKAIQAFDEDLILILGGYDKKTSFTRLMEELKGRAKTLVLIGQTQELLARQAEDQGIPYKLVASMEEAVAQAREQSDEGDIVLLSPACASWDMYPSFEARGDDFKNLVEELET